MNIYLLKKWLSTALVTVVLTSLLVGCPANKTPADQAFKEAYSKMWIDSYHYEGVSGIEIKADESALLGTKGGLSATEAQEELLFATKLQSPDGQQMLALLQSGKITFHGAADGKNKQYDMIAGVDYEQDGIKMALEIPLLIDFKEEPALYVDPKVGSVFNLLPPQLNGKLVKISIQDFPGLTEAQQAKFKTGGLVFKKIQEILTASILKLDAALFQDVEVTEEAKKAGATRTIKLTLTPEQNKTLSNEMAGQLLDTFGPDFGLTPSQITAYKQQLLTNKKDSLADSLASFMGNSVTHYSLDGQGQIVYIVNTQQLKGAKHTGKITTIMTLKNYGKALLTIDPSKQGSISLTELLGLLGF